MGTSQTRSRADSLIAAGEVEEAKKLLRLHCSDQPGDVEARIRLIHLHKQQQEWQDAFRAADALVRQQPDRIEGYHEQAESLLGMGRLERAKAIFLGLSHRYPKQPHGWRGLAWVAFLQHRWQDALAQVDVMTAQFPEEPDIPFIAGNAAKELGRYDDAVSYFERQTPAQVRRSLFSFLETYQRLGRWDDAARLVAQAVGRPADHPRTGKAAVPRIFITGDSHIANAADMVTRFFKAPGVELSGRMFPAKDMPLADQSISEDFAEIVDLARAADLVVFAPGGNEHTAFGLAQHPTKYSFLGAARPGEIYVPYRLVEKALESQMTRTRNLMRFFAAAVRVPMIVLESPPPCPSAKHILETVDANLRPRIEEFGINSAENRMALWRMRAGYVRTLGNELGMRYVAAPPASQDADGFLLEPLWGNATHGNDRYALLILDQIADIARTDGTR